MEIKNQYNINYGRLYRLIRSDIMVEFQNFTSLNYENFESYIFFRIKYKIKMMFINIYQMDYTLMVLYFLMNQKKINIRKFNKNISR